MASQSVANSSSNQLPPAPQQQVQSSAPAVPNVANMMELFQFMVNASGSSAPSVAAPASSAPSAAAASSAASASAPAASVLSPSVQDDSSSTSELKEMKARKILVFVKDITLETIIDILTCLDLGGWTASDISSTFEVEVSKVEKVMRLAQHYFNN